MKNKIIFEAIKHDLSDSLFRTKVPFGWLVVISSDVVHSKRDMQSGWDWRSSITFVFDPFHWWK